MAKKTTHKKLTFKFVLRQMPYAFLYYLIGSLLGALLGFVLFNLNKELLLFILTAWFKRLMFGLDIFGAKNYTLWFVINNTIALILVVVASVLIMTLVIKRRLQLKGLKKFDTFRRLEARRPKITLYGIYIVPIGALVINGFLVSLFTAYIFLDMGMSQFVNVAMLLLPHGINELIALLIASSLGLSYIKILSPLIIKRKWEECIKTGKELLGSKVTLFFIVVIALLVLFSGFLEGALGLLVLT